MPRERRITTAEQLDELPIWTVIQPKNEMWVLQKIDEFNKKEWYAVNYECMITSKELMTPNWGGEYNVIWSPQVHDPSLDISPDVMIGRKPNGN